ncbi:unnamed protein product, partial [Phaeothamnion confervicola]
MERGWRNLPILSLVLELEVKDRFRLPPFAGSMFRGCLGWALKEICSPEDYSFLFETTAGDGDAARPFVLLPPLAARNLEQGDRLQVALRLIGRGCSHVHQFLHAFKLIGLRGLGESQCKYEVVRVVAEEGERRWVCFDVNTPASTYIPLPSALGSFVQSIPADITGLEVDFVTPTRLVYRGQPARAPEFHVLVRTVLRRVSSLLQRELGPDLDVDYQLEIERSQSVEWKPLCLKWEDWERKSNRQGRSITMGGLVGRVRYTGRFEPEILSLLQCARLLHLGKATTFGMGSLEVYPLLT